MRKYSAWYVGLSINTYILEFWARGFSPKLAQIELKGMSLKVPFKYIVNRYKLHDREHVKYCASRANMPVSDLFGYSTQVLEGSGLTMDMLDTLASLYGGASEPFELTPALENYCATDAAVFSRPVFDIDAKNSPLVNMGLDFPN